MTGDVEVLAGARRVDLGEDPHPQLGQQRTHLLDVTAVARVDVHHHDLPAGVQAQAVLVFLEGGQPVLVAVATQVLPVAGASELGPPPPLPAHPDHAAQLHQAGYELMLFGAERGERVVAAVAGHDATTSTTTTRWRVGIGPVIMSIAPLDWMSELVGKPSRENRRGGFSMSGHHTEAASLSRLTYASRLFAVRNDLRPTCT